jgi:hypothetical protein
MPVNPGTILPPKNNNNQIRITNKGTLSIKGNKIPEAAANIDTL